MIIVVVELVKHKMHFKGDKATPDFVLLDSETSQLMSFIVLLCTNATFMSHGENERCPLRTPLSIDSNEAQFCVSYCKV